MSISVECQSCNKKLKAKDRLSGRRVQCPHCGNGITIPQATSERRRLKVERPSSTVGQSPTKEREAAPAGKKDGRRLVWYMGAGLVVLIAAFIAFQRIPGEHTVPQKTGDAKDNATTVPIPNEADSSPVAPPTESVSTLPTLAEAPFDASTAKRHQDAWASYLNSAVETTNSIGMKFAVIPPGSFKMGENAVDVTLTKPFRIGVHEVTQGQWDTIMQSQPTDGKQVTEEELDLAVNHVYWYQARTFCRRLTEIEREAGTLPEGWTYRLPTEAEWEWACRAGTTTAYSFGDDVSQLGDYAWYESNSKIGDSPRRPFEYSIHPVGLKNTNSWGLFDFHGNVWEWCGDLYGEEVLGGVDPRGPATGDWRVYRGGARDFDSEYCQSSFREGNIEGYAADDFGFRVALAPITKAPPPAEAPFDAVTAKQHQEAWAKELGEPIEFTKWNIDFAIIPPGRFKMGDGKTSVDVTLTKPFFLGIHEVTQEQWQAIMETEPWNGKGLTARGNNIAATQVCWEDANTFCQRLTEKQRELGSLPEGWGYRLPTEAEWEWACRAGTTTAYSFGDDASQLRDYAWFEENSQSNVAEGYFVFVRAVGLNNSNPWGLFDMHGNASEWCGDWHGNELPGGVDPIGPARGDGRIFRGGASSTSSDRCRSANRDWGVPQYLSRELGFRIALTPDGNASQSNVPTETPMKAELADAPFDTVEAIQLQRAWAKELDEPVETTNTIGMKLALIPPGRFRMGEDEVSQGRIIFEKSVDVTLTRPFRIGVHEVTQGQWKAIMDTEPWSGQTGNRINENVAVDNVSWNGASEFCRRLTERERKVGNLREDWEYRLPTEAEWEWACRAGTTTAFSFGDDGSQLGDYAWYSENSKIDGKSCVRVVGLKKPNAWALYDMHGNVSEWCLDRWADKLEGGNDPEGPAEGFRRAVRANSCSTFALWCQSGYRLGGMARTARERELGFRVVLSHSGAATRPRLPAVVVDYDDLSDLAIAPFNFGTAKQHQQKCANRLGEKIVIENSLGMKLAVIPPGTFKMGEASHTITVTTPFRLCVHEVTQGQWKEIVGTEPWKAGPNYRQGANFAATAIAFKDALTFCKQLTELERKNGLSEDWEYRLPTEVEWEWACRAGTTTAYSFGDNASKLREYAWYEQNAEKGGEAYAHEVGLKKPNPWGLFDIHGNVGEWCHDGYNERFMMHFDPVGSGVVSRGGFWTIFSYGCRSEMRSTITNGTPDLFGKPSNINGFRPALCPAID